MTNRLSSQDLVYKGQKILTGPDELAKAIQELKMTCSKSGIDLTTTEFPEKALTYNPLISKLEQHGILKPLCDPGNSSMPLPSDDEDVVALRAEHAEAVSIKI